MSSTRLARALPIVVLLGVVGCDQATKYQAVASLTVDDGRSPAARFLSGDPLRPRPPVEIIEGFWRHAYAENPGVAFSLFGTLPPAVRRVMLSLLQLSLLTFALVVYRRTPREQRLQRLGLLVAAAGGMGNLIDRARMGHVVDFVVWHVADRFRWPTFNVADAAIVVGVGLILLQQARPQPEQATPS